ncbi:MAG: hypothetical protein AB7F64_07975 [Gammaproteobacteria bacterium]
MPQSNINPHINISDTYWAVSAINIGSIIGGHAIIVVEGLVNLKNGNLRL